MSKIAKVYKYLRMKANRRGFISGIVICRNVGLPISQLAALDDLPGIGSIGPAGSKLGNRWQQHARYARTNGYCADFLVFFKSSMRYYCIKDRSLRKGCNKPVKITLNKA